MATHLVLETVAAVCEAEDDEQYWIEKAVVYM